MEIIYTDRYLLLLYIYNLKTKLLVQISLTIYQEIDNLRFQIIIELLIKLFFANYKNYVFYQQICIFTVVFDY